MTKYRVATIVPFYNEFKPLQRLLLHMSKIKIFTILCDGRFHQYQKLNDSDISKDGSRFLVSSYKNTILIDSGLCYIEEKLNKLFHEAKIKEFTHVILLGSDEYLEGNYDLFLKNLKNITSKEPMILKIPFVDHNEKFNNSENSVERVFYLPGNIIVKSIKLFYNFKKPLEKIPISTQIIEGLTIHHDSSIRNKERNDLMKEYQKLIKEKKF